MSELRTKLTVLLRDYGYKFEGDYLLSMRDRRIVSNHRNSGIFGAAESLVWKQDAEFKNRWLKITNPEAYATLKASNDLWC